MLHLIQFFFFHLNLFRIYLKINFLILCHWKYFSINLSFFSYSLEEKNWYNWANFKHLEKKINNSIAKASAHYWIICLYSINICYDILVTDKLFDFFWNIFNFKAIKVCYINIIHTQSYLLSSYWFVLIKIYHICAILYFR